MKLDERGKQCPKPVIDTKKALESCNPGETVEVLVDNEIAVQNLSKMAASKGLSAVSEKISDNEFSVKIPVGQGVTPASGAPDDSDEEPACLTAAKRAWQWFCPPTLWATVTLNLERLS
jgi:TusA-related sulfurtransferase